MRLAIACVAGVMLFGAPAPVQDVAALTPRTLRTALEAKPASCRRGSAGRADPERFRRAGSARQRRRGEDRRVARRVRRRDAAARGQRTGATGGLGCGPLFHGAHPRRHDQRLRRRRRTGARHGVYLALRDRPAPARRWTARGLRNASRQQGAARRAERHGQADAAVAEHRSSRARRATGGSMCRRSTGRRVRRPSWCFRTAPGRRTTCRRSSTT